MKKLFLTLLSILMMAMFFCEKVSAVGTIAADCTLSDASMSCNTLLTIALDNKGSFRCGDTNKTSTATLTCANNAEQPLTLSACQQIPGSYSLPIVHEYCQDTSGVAYECYQSIETSSPYVCFKT